MISYHATCDWSGHRQLVGRENRPAGGAVDAARWTGRWCAAGRSAGLLALATLSALALASGCSRQGDGAAEDEPRQLRCQAKRGPVRVSVRVEPAKALLSEELTMTVTIEHEQGVSVEKPVFAESMGDFRIVDVREPLPQTKDRREIIRQVLTLLPTRIGQLPIFPIAVHFSDTRPGGDGGRHVAVTDELTVQIASVVRSEVTDLDQLRAEAPPVALPPSYRTLIWTLAVIALLTAVGVIWWWKRRRERPPGRSSSPLERWLIWS